MAPRHCSWLKAVGVDPMLPTALEFLELWGAPWCRVRWWPWSPALTLEEVTLPTPLLIHSPD